jgi:hypothetical protein
MKKLKQRRGMVALAALAIALLCGGGDSVWEGLTHHGSGVWTFGGDEPGTGGNVGTDEHSEIVSEHQYKRECYRNAVVFFLFAGGLLWGVIGTWKERDELENSWERAISHPESLQDIHKHPEFYRKDFKKWINENHPHLKIWTLPPNSSN